MSGKRSAIYCAIFAALLASITCQTLVDKTGNVQLTATPGSNGINIEVKYEDEVKLSGVIGYGTDLSNVSCLGEPTCIIGNDNIEVASIDSGFQVTWATKNTKNQFKDCFYLEPKEQNWYGGPERWSQQWPIEKLTIDGSVPYVLSKTDNFAVVERYWLNSRGAYIFVDDRAPLWVDQNKEEVGRLCFIAKAQDPYVNRERILFQYKIVLKDNPKEAHLHAINSYLGKPTGHPNENMVAQPIWTTWAKYKTAISDDIVLKFAQDVYDHGFTEGQIEIDDDWEVCYGAQSFKTDKFADITNTVSKLKKMNYRVTLWIHPFVNSDCQDNAKEGAEKDYFVKNTTGDDTAVWWDGTDAHQIDFTNADAAEWFSARLRLLQKNHGIDSFKFDAGETNYAPQPSVYNGVDVELVPNILSGSYIRTCAKFGDLIEVRSAWRTQDLPMFTRMIDKDSNWSLDNGLHSLITTLLQMNMNGYTMVLPDMIGGNGYFGLPTAELIVRWTQANTFMPSMQFSYLPWDITSDQFDGVAIVKKFVALHKQYADVIIKAMENSVTTGAPVNAPIWWLDPTDRVALANDDEFLLGETILVAPVIVEGATSRSVYLPKGSWTDGNNASIYTGPLTLTDYPAPIDILPYFIRN